jgi:hypothetical protein
MGSGRRGAMDMGAGMGGPGMMQQTQGSMMGGTRGMMGRAMMGSMGAMGGMAGMGATMGGAPETASPTWKSDEKRVMIRALDFTVSEDTTYRYRVRIVVYNPNYKREDVSKGTDNTSRDLRGPWSQETDVVTMPPDAMPYVIGTFPSSSKNDTKVRFQVVRFNPSNGVTVPRNFDASPGEVIGDLRSAEVPASDGSGKKSMPIDFSTRQLVLNADGGGFQQLPAGLIGTPIERPALSILLRPDGSIVVHNEADDTANEVRKDIQANYKHEIDASGKKRQNSMGTGYAAMMQGMMGGGGMMMRSMMGRGRGQ